MEKARILMVEDEPEVLSCNAEYLAGQGYEPIPAGTLAQARFLIDERAPDLILLDVMMPDGSGFDFCREIRQKTSAPVIFLTARNENESELRGLQDGGSDYITKPYHLSVLGERIKLRLRDAGFAATRRLELPPLCIDLDADTVTLSGEEIALTRKELLLLWQLANSEGRRVSCEALYRHIWGSEPVNATNTIAIHISNIRKKLRLDGNAYFEIRSTGTQEYVFNQIRFD
jgi:DNA-binding response OmpR family regulator